jgi:hypothetical protein
MLMIPYMLEGDGYRANPYAGESVSYQARLDGSIKHESLLLDR